MKRVTLRESPKNPLAVIPTTSGGGGGIVDWVERLALPVVWLALILAFSLAMPSSFPHMGNISAILGSQVIVLIPGFALLIPLIAGDYDLSVAYNMAFVAMVITVLNVNGHWPILLAALLGIVIGGTVGVINAVVTLVFRIDSLIVTLGTGTLISGLAAWISGQAVITGVSSSLVRVVAIDRFLSIPFEFWYGFGMCIVLSYVLSFTPIGRRLLFVGRNRSVSQLSGIRVARVRFGAFVVAGLIAGLGGIILAGTLDGADPSAGPAYLLPGFAAAFLGATTLTPGRFNPWGLFIAVYFLGTGTSGLQLLGIASWIQPVFYGGSLVLAVVFSQLVRGRQALNSGER